MSAHNPEPSKETIFIHELSPQLEEELLRRARENGRDPSEEASEIIKEHVEYNEDNV